MLTHTVIKHLQQDGLLGAQREELKSNLEESGLTLPKFLLLSIFSQRSRIDFSNEIKDCSCSLPRHLFCSFSFFFFFSCGVSAL